MPERVSSAGVGMGEIERDGGLAAGVLGVVGVVVEFLRRVHVCESAYGVTESEESLHGRACFRCPLVV